MASRRRAKKATHFETVNRWCLDFYVAEALDAFRDDEYRQFSQIRDHLQSLLEMPIEANSSLPMKLLIIQFLSRIYDGDKLGIEFELDSVTPLESAMNVLEKICAEVEVPQSDLERVHTSLREMVVVVCIKSKDFKKAKEMLEKHFPTRKNPVGKAKLLSDLVQRKYSTHPTLEQPSYSQFRQNMLDFIERVYTMPQPFLSMIVRKRNEMVEESQIIKRRSRRLEYGTQTENHIDLTSEPRQEQDAPEHSSSVSADARLGYVTLQVLRQVYESQAQKLGLNVPFSTLMEEVYKEAEEEAQKEAQGGQQQQQQQQQQQVVEVEVVEIQKDVNPKENVPEKTPAVGEEVCVEATESDTQAEDEEEEEKRETDSLHLHLSETPQEDFEKEEVVAQHNGAAEEEEEEEAAMEEEEQEEEPDRGKDADEGDESIEVEQKESKSVREKEEEESVLVNAERDVSDDDAVVPAVSPPHPSSSDTDNLFSQAESPSLLAQPKRLTRSRCRDDPPAAHSDITSPSPPPSSNPQTPTSKSPDPAEHAKPAVNVIGGSLLSRIIGGRYCKVTMPQLIMLPDSQPVTYQSEKLSTSDPDSAAENSMLDEPLLPSELEENIRTPPLSSTPDREERRGRGRLRDSLLNRRSKESPPDTPNRGSSSATRNSRDKGFVTPSRSTSGATSRRAEELGSGTPSSSNTPGCQKDPIPDTPTRGSGAGAKRRKGLLPTTPGRPGPGSALRPNNSSTDEGPQDFSLSSSPPNRKRRKELTMSKMMNVTATREEWSDEDSLFSSTRKTDVTKSNGRKRMWTEEETRWVKEGVERFGVGNWAKIREAFPFEGRTSVNIKDRWRTMKSNGTV
ncbi:telomeric repeat binding factor a [Alosa sapidissima]|uniref:telomeric repeat binding factor a n=1 Tax=Alosa sapidissima TaxID=34773 RepID=UPI001C0825FF|nr:telomeric repeat binding factor a [Alosa sapidissima]